MKKQFVPIIATPYNPPTKQKAKPAVKRLDPEYANRKILVLKAMLRDGDINKKQFARIKAEIIARVVAL